MRPIFLICAAIALASPLTGATAAPQLADSKLANSTVSVQVEPQLNDGRLVIKIAAKNGTAAPVAFGPGSVSISKAAGQPIALSSLPQLINDVRIAAGMPVEGAGGAPTAGAYASRIQPQGSDGSGKMDVTGYSAGSSFAPQQMRQWSKKSIDQRTAETQIATLNQAILKDTTIAPGQIAVGQIVSQKLSFKKGEDRTLHLVVHIAGDEHGFTIAAPGE